MALLAIKKYIAKELNWKLASIKGKDCRYKLNKRTKRETEHLQEMLDCLERVGGKLDNCTSNCNLHSVSQRSELLAFIAEVDEKRKEYPIAHDEEIVEMILKANCG